MLKHFATILFLSETDNKESSFFLVIVVSLCYELDLKLQFYLNDFHVWFRYHFIFIENPFSLMFGSITISGEKWLAIGGD